MANNKKVWVSWTNIDCADVSVVQENKFVGRVIQVGISQTFGMKKLQIRYFLFIILFLPIILLGCNQESSKEIAPHEADPETDEEKQFYESIDMTRERTGQILKIANVSRITTLDPQVTED